MSKVTIFKQLFLDAAGRSQMIDRYKLPYPIAYTSGDGIFRSDGQLGKKYKFARFHKNWNSQQITKLSSCWRHTITSEEKIQLENDFAQLVFPPKPGISVHFIKFYGLSEKPIHNQGIRTDIVKYITSLPCAVCKRTDGIECDHKNDLYMMNEPRLLCKEQQTIADFQPLCKHCNDVKRSENSVKIKKTFETTGMWKRQPSPYPGAPFLPNTGGEDFDPQNPKWYVGTYWGDVEEFNRHLTFS